MGWGSGTNAQGRPIGYAVIALCDTRGCLAPIDRGLSYACGGEHDGGEHGCGGYFCGEHLLIGWSRDEETSYGQVCASCLDDLHAAEQEAE